MYQYAPNIGLSQVKVPAFSLKTAGSPADVASIAIPFSMSKYVVKAAWVRAATAAATLQAATIDLRTAAGGAGSSILSGATALTSLTAAGKVQTINCVTSDALSSQIIYVYQTVDSGNAGTVEITLELIDLT